MTHKLTNIFRSLCICFMIISRTIEERAYRSSSESDFSHHLAQNYPAHSIEFFTAAPVVRCSHGCLSGRADRGHHRRLHYRTDVLYLLSKIKMNRLWEHSQNEKQSVPTGHRSALFFGNRGLFIGISVHSANWHINFSPIVGKIFRQSSENSCKIYNHCV